MTPVQRKAIAVALATAIAAPAEGLRRVAYFDPGGVLTVCFGDTRNVDPNREYTLAECRARLDTRMAEAIDQVDRCVPGLPVRVLAAFADAVYNLGPAIACDQRTSTAARYLAAGRLLDACHQLPRWDNARIAGVLMPLPGLTKRRALERDICVQGAS